MILTWGSVIGFFVILYYYQYLRIGFQHHINQSLNNTMLILGSLVCFGTAIVGCNQRPNIAILHAIGAFYCGFATYMSYTIKKFYPEAYPNWFIFFRGTLVVLEALSFILMLVFSAQRANSRTKATLGNTFEWCVVSIQCIFYATFAVEFSNLKQPGLVIGMTRKAELFLKRGEVENDEQQMVSRFEQAVATHK